MDPTLYQTILDYKTKGQFPIKNKYKNMKFDERLQSVSLKVRFDEDFRFSLRIGQTIML